MSSQKTFSDLAFASCSLTDTGTDELISKLPT